MWEYHNQAMIKIKKIYNRTSKQTQNRIQELINSFNIDYEHLYNIADTKTKKKINTYIEKWQDEGLLTGYFGMLAKSMYKKTRVKNSEILELLVYGAYTEEQNNLEEIELNTFKDVANYYYQEGQKEVNNTLTQNKRKVSVIPDAIFLALLDMSNSQGYVWKQYTNAVVKYNAEQIYRQIIIDMQQQKEIDIQNDIYQNIIKKQQNIKLCINEDKISGSLDNELIGINNMAKVEGIKSVDNNAQIRFMATIDGNETDMCHSLDNQLFYIDKENEFDRYYGETQKELSIQRIKCFGLVVGLNLPPIAHHFHYCRSSITYQVSVEKDNKIKYNLDIPKINKEVNNLLKDTKINKKVKRLFKKYLTDDNVIIDYNNKPMYYDIEKDRIVINPMHKDFKHYDLQESLSHEIIHMIDKRNNISEKIDISNPLRRLTLEINANDDKYRNLLTNPKYEDNMTLGDIFSAITKGEISNNFGHEKGYWLQDISRVEKEISANIMSAYLTNNKDTLNIINSIPALKEIKERIKREYDKYTR